jgi:hypothetical protein
MEILQRKQKAFIVVLAPFYELLLIPIRLLPSALSRMYLLITSHCPRRETQTCFTASMRGPHYYVAKAESKGAREGEGHS